MALVITFLLGMGNFACHRAVMSSGHPLIAQMAKDKVRVLQRVSLAVEFALLVGALYAAGHAAVAWVWAYAAYTLVNLGAAWALLRH